MTMSSTPPSLQNPSGSEEAFSVRFYKASEFFQMTDGLVGGGRASPLSQRADLNYVYVDYNFNLKSVKTLTTKICQQFILVHITENMNIPRKGTIECRLHQKSMVGDSVLP